MNYLIQQSQTIGVITLKEITDLIEVRHDKAKLKIEELAKEPSFGSMSILDIQYSSGKNTTQTIQTYSLNKKQAIAVAARLNNALLMKVIDRLEELEKQNSFKVPQTFHEALLLAADLEKQNQTLY
jgi:Phage regulatory protein Rha (Phage_pRha).